jgi:hypothetical protein
MDGANLFSRRGFLSSLAAFGVAGVPRLRAETMPLKMQPIRGGGADSVLDITRIELPVGATKHIATSAALVMPSPDDIVHLRPIRSAIRPAVANPTTLATPPMIVSSIVELDAALI